MSFLNRSFKIRPTLAYLIEGTFMVIGTMENPKDKILNCEIQDESGLNDFQKLPDKSAIAINQVGIERFRLPVTFKHYDGTMMTHDCEASMFVYLQAGKTGVNMSRFCTILQEEAGKQSVDANFIKTILHRYRKDLRDFDTEDLIPESFLKLKLNYPLKQKSLKSDNWGWQYYEVELEGYENKDTTEASLTVKYEYSSTCPCSLSMSKQYEKDYAQGKTDEGSGIAAAHSQRSIATVKTKFDLSSDYSIEALVSLLRTALPTETQVMVKRVDEQAFAILNGENPMFVEHATRRLAAVLNKDQRIIDWEAKVEHIESLHSHNAVAVIRKNNQVM